MKTHLTVIFLIIKDGAILLEKKRDDKWYIPGGHINGTESPVDTIVRETNEELGLDVRFVDNEKLFADEPTARCLPTPFASFEHIVERDSMADERHTNVTMAYIVSPINTPKAREGQSIRWFTGRELAADEHVRPAARAIALAGLEHCRAHSKPL